MAQRKRHFKTYYIRDIITCIMLIVGGIPTHAQDQALIIKKELNATSVVDHDSLYYELFKLNMFGDVYSAKKYALLSYSSAKVHGHPERLAKACRAIAFTLDKTKQPDSAKYYYREGIEVSKRFKLDKTLTLIYNDYGRILESHDVYDSALIYYNHSLEVASNIGSEKDEAIALNNIGLVFYYLLNYQEALENLQASAAIKRKNNDKTLRISLMNIALIYNEQGKYDESISILKEVENECKSGCDDLVMSDLNFYLGYAYFEKNEKNRAYDYFVKSFEQAKRVSNNKKIAFTMYHFALFKLDKEDYKGAIEDLKEAEQLALSINLKRLQKDIYQKYTEVYEELNDLPKVIEYQNKYISIKDDIFNEQLASNLKDIQLDAQRKQSDVIIQQKDTEIEKVRLITTLVGVISILLVIVSILIYRNYRVSHRMKGILEKEIEKRTSELVKSNADLTQMTQEYDQLVYRASHDIRGPLATLMGLTNIAKQDTEEPLRVRDYLAKIESTAHGLNQTLSQLMETNRIRNLPICIEEVDLGKLVDEVYSSFRNLNHFPLISLRIEKGDWKKPLQSDKNLIGFVLSKLLDNAFHYFATHKQEKYIKVSWSQTANTTTIAVEDNGLGINDQAREKIFQLFYVASDVHGSGLGLFLAQMAANRLGGRVILARSSGPTIFKLIISTNLAKLEQEDRPRMTVTG